MTDKQTPDELDVQLSPEQVHRASRDALRESLATRCTMECRFESRFAPAFIHAADCPDHLPTDADRILALENKCALLSAILKKADAELEQARDVALEEAALRVHWAIERAADGDEADAIAAGMLMAAEDEIRALKGGKP